MSKIKTIETVSRVVKIDNSNDANREYILTANAEIRDNALVALNDGEVKDLEGNGVASFGIYGDSRLSMNTWVAVDETMVLSVIKAFKADVESELASL